MLLELLFTFVITLFFIVITLKYSEKLKLIDIPNERSFHDIPKPRSGGISIFLTIFLSILFFDINFFTENIYFFISLTFVFVIGVLDDMTDISPKYKFIFITVSTVLLFFYSDIRIDAVGNWFGVDIKLPLILSFVFTVFAINGLTNAINLVDGLDGLLGGLSLVIFLSFVYLGMIFHDDFIVVVSLLFIFSLIGFLIFNWYPSKLFLGDSGSLVIGFSISVISVRLIEYMNAMAILFLVLIPIVDTFIVMRRRTLRKLSPFKADKTHIHHKFVNWKKKVDFTVVIIILFQILFSLIGILNVKQNSFIYLLIFLVMLFLFYILFDERQVPRYDRLFSFHIKIRKAVLKLFERLL